MDEIYIEYLLDKMKHDMYNEGFLDAIVQSNSMWEIIGDLTSEQFLWLRNNKYFLQIAKEIGSKSVSFKQNNLPSPETSLDSVFFNNDFDKLILRIRNSTHEFLNKNALKLGGKLSDVLNLTVQDLQKLPGVGKKYIKLWVELSSLYESSSFKYSQEDLLVNISDQLENLDLINLSIKYQSLSNDEIKVLEKLERLNLYKGISDLIYLDIGKLSSTEGIGKKYIITLKGLKKKIQYELVRISRDDKGFDEWESDLILNANVKTLSVHELGDILLEDIDGYLDGLDDDSLNIFQGRWGFVEPEETLQGIADKQGLTRERIRQKEKQINKSLMKILRLSQENIWGVIKEDVDLELASKMKGLSSCFESEKKFYTFLGCVSGDKDINSILRPDINLSVLNNYFSVNGFNKSYVEVEEYISESLLQDNSENKAGNIIHYLEEQDRLVVNKNNISPLNLKKHEAAACVLSTHPNGLPWRDVSHLVNSLSISRTNLLESRIDNQALSDSELIYLAGKGIYKHTKFIDFESVDIDSIFSVLLQFFDDTCRDVFHLNEVYHNSSILKSYDYYVVRYIVKMYGEDYGFYFDGKSQSDSVGVEDGFKNITQQDVILQAMHTNIKPMTKPEIASLLKSNSIAHASFYLDSLIKKELVVQVDRMLYTTPELAYKDIDVSIFVKGIEHILSEENRIVDPSIFQIVLNEKLHVNYSKAFYASIAKLYSSEMGWFRKHNLFSSKEITYKNLTDAINFHCDLESDDSINISLLNKHISITKDSARTSISNWRHIN